MTPTMPLGKFKIIAEPSPGPMYASYVDTIRSNSVAPGDNALDLQGRIEKLKVLPLDSGCDPLGSTLLPLHLRNALLSDHTLRLR